MQVVVYPPAKSSLDAIEPIARWSLELEIRSAEVVWSRRGCDTLRVDLVPIDAQADTDVPWRYIPVRWASHVVVLVDGMNVWEGFVTELRWERGSQLVGFTAAGYDQLSHDYIRYTGTYGNLLPSVVGQTAPFLKVVGAPPIETSVTTATEYTVADACEFLRRIATADGLLVDVRAEPGGILRITTWDSKPFKVLKEVPLVVPPDATVSWPRYQELATEVVVRYKSGNVISTVNSVEPTRVADLGFSRRLIVDVTSSIVANPSAIAYRLLYERFAPAPSLSWSGIATWERADNTTVSPTKLQVGDVIFVPGYGPIRITRVVHRYPGPTVTIEAGRPATPDEALQKLRLVMEAAMLGRDPNTWW
jgi:hypothetical protein